MQRNFVSIRIPIVLYSCCYDYVLRIVTFMKARKLGRDVLVVLLEV